MGIDLIGLSGTNQQLEIISNLTALVMQDPRGQAQLDDMGAAADPGAELAAAVKVSFGLPFLIEVVCHGAETDGQTHNFAVFSKNCPFKFKVCLTWGIVLDETGTIAADTIQLFRGDGATSEAFTAITDAMTCNVNDDDIYGLAEGTSQFDQDAAVIDVNESLRLQMVLADSTNHNVAIKQYILAMRCTADE